MTDQEKLLRRFGRIIAFTAVVVVFLAVIVVALEIQLQTRNTRLARLDVAVHQTKAAADKATDAADHSKKVVDAALAQARASSGSGPSGADIAAALRTITTIEQQIQQILNRR